MAPSAPALKTRFTALALAMMTLSISARAAVVAATLDCDASGLQCRLNNILSLLYGISAVLGVVLFVVIIAAVRSYFRLRNKRKLLP